MTTLLPIDDFFISEMLTEQNRTPQYVQEARSALELLSREKSGGFIEVGLSESYPTSIRWEWLEHCGISAPSGDYSVLNALVRSGYPKSGRWTDWAPTLLTHYFRQFPKPLSVHYIRAFRHIPTRLEEFKEEHDVDKARERGIIDMLAEWQNPELSNWSQKQKFRTLEHFLCSVLKRSVKIEVTSTKSAIIIEEYGRPVHLEALGTGIHQLLYFIIEALSKSRAVVCIEEPELHLHPELQNQLMRFLSKETDNQYFITNHSPHLIDSADAAIFQVFMDGDGVSHVQSAPGLCERRRFLHQLGYRPSDIRLCSTFKLRREAGLG